MSANHRAPMPAHFQHELTSDEKAERDKYSPIPNIPRVTGAVDWICKDLRIEVTEHYIRRYTNNKKLASHVIGHVVHYSERDLYDFIVLGTRRESTSAKEKSA
jgi:hypothetical protein